MGRCFTASHWLAGGQRLNALGQLRLEPNLGVSSNPFSTSALPLWMLLLSQAGICHRASECWFSLSLFLIVCTCSVVSDSATPWMVAHQTPLSMGFSGKNSGVGCHFLLQEIFLTQGSNLRLLCLLHCRRILYTVSPWGSSLCQLSVYWAWAPRSLLLSDL